MYRWSTFHNAANQIVAFCVQTCSQAIKSCNSYASNNHMKSTVQFTTNYSQTHFMFLDTKVKFNNGKLVNELYAKPSASFQYLHRTSYHPPHTFRAITKSLQCNTLKFGKRFFHQIKGTAMGTPMACNYANVFMGKFEQLMLRDYEISFDRKPSVWLRYIDDIFFFWNGDETSLKHFILSP